MNKTILSIGQVNDYVKGLMSRDPILNRIWIRGEISNLATPSSGHMYFTLKDETARIRCVMFRQDRQMINFIPTDGMQVVVKGQVSLYTKHGQYQLYAYEMEPDGVGGLHAAFDALKNKLEKEGLFDAEHKKTIPKFPKKVAVITSRTGAAIRDIIDIAQRRCGLLSILVVPVLVQGEYASEQISAALDYVNTRDDIDVIITGRGGGSIEELWAFNEEKVARAIWSSRIPVVSAVGHETDNTIADLVADLRAPTPSAAAELIAPDMEYFERHIEAIDKKLYDSIDNILRTKKRDLSIIENNYTLRYPDRIIQSYDIELDRLQNNLFTYTKEHIRQDRESLSKLSTHLDALSPLRVLSRGYAIVTDEEDEVISTIDQLSKDDYIDMRLQDGTVKCQVTDFEEYKHGEEGNKDD